MKLAKLLEVKDQNDPIFLEIRNLMNEKRALGSKFNKHKGLLSAKHCSTDALIDGTLVHGVSGNGNKRQKSSQSSICASLGFSTPAVSTSSGAGAGAPTASFSFITTARTHNSGGNVAWTYDKSHNPANVPSDKYQSPSRLVFPDLNKQDDFDDDE
jgi:hypothetical protein